MIYAAGPGPTYSELAAMDFFHYSEVVEARLLWQEEWNPKPQLPNFRRR